MYAKIGETIIMALIILVISFLISVVMSNLLDTNLIFSTILSWWVAMSVYLLLTSLTGLRKRS